MPAKSAEVVSQNLTLSRKARKLLGPGASAGAFLRALVEASCWNDAVSFMAQALPARQAVWWACLCVRHRVGEKAADVDRNALYAATRCVVAPTEAHWKQAGEAAKVLDARSPSGCVARAAVHAGFQRGVNAPVASARPELAVRLAAAAILLAAASAGPKLRALLCRQYIFIGLDVARSALHWE
jgi:hypothetical protein